MTVSGGGLLLSMPAFVPYALTWAPNAGKSVSDMPVEPTSESSWTLRLTVGEPTASLQLRVIEPRDEARATLLLLHGMYNRKEALLDLAEVFAADGFRCVLVDSRGHGRSTGEKLTYGIRESRDLSEVLDELDRRGALTAPVAALGFSYGAATACQAAGRDPRIRAVISCSGFTSLHDVTGPYLRRFMPFGDALLDEKAVDEIVRRASDVVGMDLSAARPLDAVRRSTAMFLFAHGADDPAIPAEQSTRLARAADSRGHLAILPGVRHHDLVRSAEFVAEARRFLLDAVARPRR